MLEPFQLGTGVGKIAVRVAAASSAQGVCRYLGVAGDAERHETYPTARHRCHLWSLREQVDIIHQSSYCLTEAHRRCPWLSVPPPGVKPADRKFPAGKAAASGGGLLAALALTVAMFTGGLPAVTGFSLDLKPFGSQTAAAAAVAPLVSAQPSGSGASSPQDSALRTQDAKTVFPAGSLSAPLLKSDAPSSVSAKLDQGAGGTVVAGNVGLSFSSKSLSEAEGNVTVNVQANPKANVPGGPAQFSPNGTIVDITVKDQAGKLVTTFPEPVDVLFKYNSADLAMARGNANILSVAYILDQDSPEIENPNHFPVGTWVFAPSTNVKLDATSGTLAFRTQAIGSIFSVVANSIGFGQTLRPDVQLFSSFDPGQSQVFGALKQFSYLKVLEPQIGSRLYVMDVNTGSYAYVDARDVGPSGPPAVHSTN